MNTELTKDSQLVCRFIKAQTGQKSETFMLTPEYLLRDIYGMEDKIKDLAPDGDIEDFLKHYLIDILHVHPPGTVEPEEFEEFSMIPLFTLKSFFELIFGEDFQNVASQLQTA